MSSLPLANIKVIEFSHMVMGPTCGLILADLGAQVIKVEPLEGDRTRTLLGAGAGFYPMFNRNKESICLNLNTPQGREVAHTLCLNADVVIENFRGGYMEKFALDYASLRAPHPRLIYASLKGFLPGPYEHRTALDEVVQMMGGLAYMTGRSGDPLRAGSSVNDIMGGMFAAIGILAALRTRDQTGEGTEVLSGLFENNVFLVGQHIMQYAATGAPPKPMPERVSPWAIYDVFTVADGQIFLAVVSDSQWATFCQALSFDDLARDTALAKNNDRVRARSTLLPDLRQRLSTRTVQETASIFEQAGLPFAPITRPHELIDDPHVRDTGTLAPIKLTDGERAGHTAQSALLPIMLNRQRLGIRQPPPRAGQDTVHCLHQFGLSHDSITKLQEQGVIR